MDKNKLTVLTSEDKIECSQEIDSLIKTHDDLMQLRKEHADLLVKEKSLSTSVQELKDRIYPTVYLSLAKHHRTKKPYIKAKSPWKDKNGEVSFLWAYVGALDLFPKGLEDPKAKQIAARKIRQLIRTKYPL